MGGDGHGEAMMDRGNKYMTREGRMVQSSRGLDGPTQYGTRE